MYIIEGRGEVVWKISRLFMQELGNVGLGVFQYIILDGNCIIKYATKKKLTRIYGSSVCSVIGLWVI
jgi:hypothetical protein